MPKPTWLTLKSIFAKAKGLLANAEKTEQGLRSLIDDGAVPRLTT